MSNALDSMLDALVASRMDPNAGARKALTNTVVGEQEDELLRRKGETIEIFEKKLSAAVARSAPAEVITCFQRLMDRASQA